jgi:hypothetical protein
MPWPVFPPVSLEVIQAEREIEKQRIEQEDARIMKLIDYAAAAIATAIDKLK